MIVNLLIENYYKPTQTHINSGTSLIFKANLDIPECRSRDFGPCNQIALLGGVNTLIYSHETGQGSALNVANTTIAAQVEISQWIGNACQRCEPEL